jgi:uncharacterized protein (UPF0333 family)
MLAERNGFWRRLHEDDNAPGTVEWVLLVVVALVVLIGIYYLAQGSFTSASAKAALEQNAQSSASTTAAGMKGISM